MKIAWIGLGRIGEEMALRVLGAGHDLVGHARTPEKAARVALAGARITGSLTDAVGDAEMVCVNVYSEDQLRDALLGRGALAAMRSGTVLAIHSTVGPALIAELAAVRKDVSILDAAFSGTNVDAANGMIALMVGGDAGALETARPVFASYADYIARVGPAGAGMLLKLVNNAMFGAHMLLAFDAVRLLRAGGMDIDVAVATLARSSGGSFAVRQFGGGADPDQKMQGIRPYIEKDVGVALSSMAAMNLDLGMIATGTRPFAARV